MITKISIPVLWWWNRFKIRIAYMGKDFKYDIRDMSHLEEYKYCNKSFEAWKSKNGE